jgi:probable addiction module antidote protein
MAQVETTPWDSSDLLKTEEDVALYLEACLDEGDPSLISHSLCVAARARLRRVQLRPASIPRPPTQA